MIQEMKPTSLLLALVTLAVALPSTQAAEPARVTILKTDGKKMIGYIRNTNDKGIQFSYTEQDPQPIGVPHTDIRAVSFDEEGDIIGPARYAYSRHQWEEAEKAFREVAEEYEYLWGIKREQLGNFASEARFFQIDCLRRLGYYSELGDALATQSGQSLESTIDEVHLPKLRLLQMWSHTAAEDWDTLEAALKDYEKPMVGKQAELFDVPLFKPDLPPSEIAQLSFMRGRMFEAREKSAQALDEYYAAMTMDYGEEKILTRDAMKSALYIQSKSPTLEKSYNEQKELHSLAVFYKEAYNDGEIDALYMEYLKAPEMPEAMKKQLEAAEQKKAEEAAKAKATEEAAASTEAKPEEKPKDKGKG